MIDVYKENIASMYYNIETLESFYDISHVHVWHYIPVLLVLYVGVPCSIVRMPLLDSHCYPYM